MRPSSTPVTETGRRFPVRGPRGPVAAGTARDEEEPAATPAPTPEPRVEGTLLATEDLEGPSGRQTQAAGVRAGRTLIADGDEAAESTPRTRMDSTTVRAQGTLLADE